jgi:uncharacterized protein (DUF4415 family)
MRPEEALEAARQAAARGRSEGRYPEARSEKREATRGPDLSRLREWAIIEIDRDVLYSTRRAGAPITWLKRMLLRMLRQYTTELEAQQTRFNVGVVAYLESLEKQRKDG